MESEDVIARAMLRYRNSATPEHIHLRTVHQAMVEIIVEQGLKPSPTAYFAATMAALERELKKSVEAPSTSSMVPLLTAMLGLLSMAISQVPQPILKARWSASLPLVLEAMNCGADGDEGESFSALWKSGLHCVQCLLQVAVSEKKNWANAVGGFEILINSTVDARPKVRKKAQECLVDLFASLISSPLHGTASEAYFALCQKLMVAAMPPPEGSRKKGAPLIPQGAAISALHMLGALRQVLPLLSSSAIGRLVVRLVELHSLGQPLVSRQVLDCLQALFRSTAAAPVAVLGEAMAAIAAEEQKSLKREAVEVRSVIAALHLGMEKLAELDREECSRKLPVVFSTLIEKLASEQEEVVYFAADSLRAIISSCIDDAMIQEGVANQNLPEEQRSVPSVMERICALIEGCLQYQYSTAWDMALLLVSSMFQRLGAASQGLMAGTVATLGQLQDLPDADMRCRKQLHLAVGAAIANMGPAAFLSLLPLQMDSLDLSDARVWLIPILRRHTCGSQLRFFIDSLLPLAGRLRERSKKAAAEDRPVAAKNAESLVYGVWSLFPAVCNYATDVPASFKFLAKTLGDVIHAEPAIRPFVCAGLQVLIRQSRVARGDSVAVGKGSFQEDSPGDDVDDQLGNVEQQMRERLTAELAKANLAAMAVYSKNFLPLLFNAFVGSPAEKRADLQDTIAAFVCISEPPVVKTFFLAVMQKLLEATQESANKMDTGEAQKLPETSVAKRCTFMDLALSMAPGLDEEPLAALYSTAKAAMQDPDPGIQKRAYKLIATLCNAKKDFVGANIDDLVDAAVAGLPSCLPSTRRHRLLCLHHIIIHVLQSGESKHEDSVSTLLTEIILATKEVNNKTRNSAYDLLIAIPRAMEAGAAMDANEASFRFFSMVAAGLGGSTPHMMSATVIALSRILYEYSTRLIHTVPEILPSILLLLRSNSREIIKAVLGMVKVIIARLPGADLVAHVPSLLEGLLLWCDDSKNHFKMKVRVILERLIRRCGYDTVANAMPPEHAKLLTHIKKTKEREQRKKKGGAGDAAEDAKSEGGKSRAVTARKSEWNHSNVFSDDELSDDSGDELASTAGPESRSKSKIMSSFSARSMKSRRLHTRLPEDDPLGQDEPLDLLDASRTRQLLSAPKSLRRKRDDDDDAEFESAEDGRLVITEEDKYGGRKGRNEVDDEDEEGEDGRSSRGGGNAARERKVEKRKGGTNKKARLDDVSGKKKSGSSWAYTGDEYANKRGRGSGDATRAGKLEPHAYWPLDPKMLNRREVKKVAARKGMSSVLSVGKKLAGVRLSGSSTFKGSMKKGQKSHKGQGKGKGKSKK